MGLRYCAAERKVRETGGQLMDSDTQYWREIAQRLGFSCFQAARALRKIPLNHAEVARSGVMEALGFLTSEPDAGVQELLASEPEPDRVSGWRVAWEDGPRGGFKFMATLREARDVQQLCFALEHNKAVIEFSRDGEPWQSYEDWKQEHAWRTQEQ